MSMQFATVWEAIADTIPGQTALVHGETRRTWAEYDERAARMAGALTAAGLGPEAKVGMYLYNGTEYLETQFGGFKMRAVPVNVNYRYLDEELWYLLDNADAEALVFHSSLGDRVARVLDRLPKLKLLVQVDDGEPEGPERVDGAVAYEELLAAHEPLPRMERPEDDVYMLYTGGTTGMPKGVMYAIGGITSAFVLQGYPLVGLEPPTDVSQVGELVRGRPRERQRPGVDPGLPADARHRHVARHHDPLARRRHRRHPAEPLARRPRAAVGRAARAGDHRS